MILKFFDIFLKMKDLSSSEGFMVKLNIQTYLIDCTSESFSYSKNKNINNILLSQCLSVNRSSRTRYYSFIMKIYRLESVIFGLLLVSQFLLTT